MKKQQDGYYYEKKVTWENSDSFMYLITFVLLGIHIINVVAILSGIKGIDWDMPPAPYSFVMFTLVGLGGGALVCLSLFFHEVPIRTVKYKRIGK